jgi:hypothetical protein
MEKYLLKLFIFIFICLIFHAILLGGNDGNINKILVPFASPAILDGFLNDWNDAAYDSLSVENGYVRDEYEYPKNDNDLNIFLYIKHDGHFLYMGLKIMDNFVIRNKINPLSTRQINDLIRLYFDADLDRMRTENSKEGFTCRFFASGNMICDFSDENNHGIDFFSIQTNDGWNAEIKIPFISFDIEGGSLDRPLTPGQIINFNLLYYDEDSDNFSDSRLDWEYASGHWLSKLKSHWGVLFFEKDILETKQKKSKTSPMFYMLKELYCDY